jgi:hypothetical protein
VTIKTILHFVRRVGLLWVRNRGGSQQITDDRGERGGQGLLFIYLFIHSFIQVPRHADVWGSGRRAKVFLTWAVNGGEWSASRTGRFAPGTHWIVGWSGPRAGLDLKGQQESESVIGDAAEALKLRSFAVLGSWNLETDASVVSGTEKSLLMI